jgi:hypothetical protein
MAMDFPASPALNQIYTDPVSSAMYKWNGFAWASTVTVTPSDSYTKAESDAIKSATDAANTTNFVNVPGDTMTGLLTVPTLTATGNISAGGTVTAAQLTSNANINAAGTITGLHGTFSGGTVTANQLTANAGSINGTLNAYNLGAYTHLQCNGTLAVGGIATVNTLNVGAVNINGGPLYIDYPSPTIRYPYDNIGIGLYNTGAGYSVGMYAAAGVIRFSNFYGNGGPAGNWFQIASDSCQLMGVGGAWKPGGGDWADSSDSRIKNVLGDYSNGLESILTLTPVRYTFKGNDTAIDAAPSVHAALPPPDDVGPHELVVPYANSPHYQAAVTQKEFIGLIAQAAETAFPEIIEKRSGMIDGIIVTDLRALDPSALTYALINAVKELSAINNALTERVAALEAGSF